MSKQEELQLLLEETLGSENVYFQPPTGFRMKYDCVVYELAKIEAEYADNRPYLLHDRYKVTLIYRKVDSDLPHRFAALPMCSHDRHFVNDNLYHDVFTLYY